MMTENRSAALGLRMRCDYKGIAWGSLLEQIYTWYKVHRTDIKKDQFYHMLI